MKSLENPDFDLSYSIEALCPNYSLSQQSLMLLPNSPGLEYEYAGEYGMQVENPLYQQSLMLLPKSPALEYAGEYGMQIDNSHYQQPLMLIPNSPALEYAGEYVESEMVECSNDSSHREGVIQEDQGMKGFCDTLPTIKEGMAEGYDNSSYKEDMVLQDARRFCDALPTINEGMMEGSSDHELVYHFEFEELESLSDFPLSRPNEAKDSFNASEFSSPLGETPVDHRGSGTVGGHPFSSIAGPDECKSLKTSPEDVMGCSRNINPYNITIPKVPDAVVEDCETFPKTKFCFDELLKFTGSPGVASAPAYAEMVRGELQTIVFTIVGKAFYRKMEKAGSPFFPLLQSSLQTTLHELKEKGLEVTLSVLRKETCKWVYELMSNSNQKIAAHPEHIKQIPRTWLAERGNSYPSEDQYSKIAEETGLEKKQVVNLFENARKRTFKNISGLDANLKSHFSAEIAEILRKWQTENPGKKPDPKSREKLMDQTKCSKNQIVDWFNNHKPGRDRSKKKTQRIHL